MNIFIKDTELIGDIWICDTHTIFEKVIAFDALQLSFDEF
jgi:hypothetical protein